MYIFMLVKFCSSIVPFYCLIIRAVDLHAVSIKEEMLKTKSNAQTAAEFRQKMLYRNSIQRESSKFITKISFLNFTHF